MNSMPSWHSHLFLYPPASDLAHRLLISSRELWGTQQRSQHRPRVLATSVPKNFLLVLFARLAIKRVVHKQLSPHTRSNSTIKEIRVVSRAVPKQMPKLRLPARPGNVGHDPALVVQLRERGRRVERGVQRRARVVRLVEHGEQDLSVRVDIPTRVLVVVARYCVGVGVRHALSGGRAE